MTSFVTLLNTHCACSTSVTYYSTPTLLSTVRIVYSATRACQGEREGRGKEGKDHLLLFGQIEPCHKHRSLAPFQAFTTQKSVHLQRASPTPPDQWLYPWTPVYSWCSALVIWAYYGPPISTPGSTPALSRLVRGTSVLMPHPLGASILDRAPWKPGAPTDLELATGLGREGMDHRWEEWTDHLTLC